MADTNFPPGIYEEPLPSQQGGVQPNSDELAQVLLKMGLNQSGTNLNMGQQILQHLYSSPLGRDSLEGGTLLALLMGITGTPLPQNLRVSSPLEYIKAADQLSTNKLRREKMAEDMARNASAPSAREKFDWQQRIDTLNLGLRDLQTQISKGQLDVSKGNLDVNAFRANLDAFGKQLDLIKTHMQQQELDMKAALFPYQLQAEAAKDPKFNQLMNMANAIKDPTQREQWLQQNVIPYWAQKNGVKVEEATGLFQRFKNMFTGGITRDVAGISGVPTSPEAPNIPGGTAVGLPPPPGTINQGPAAGAQAAHGEAPPGTPLPEPVGARPFTAAENNIRTPPPFIQTQQAGPQATPTTTVEDWMRAQGINPGQ